MLDTNRANTQMIGSPSNLSSLTPSHSSKDVILMDPPLENNQQLHSI